jgi:protein-S-isoprenylcysteine O-methyltransferase Ste14
VPRPIAPIVQPVRTTADVRWEKASIANAFDKQITGDDSGVMLKRSRVAVLSALWLMLLFGAAGRLDWTRGWIFVGLFSIGMAATGIVVKRANPDLVEARRKWRRQDTKPFDKIFLKVFVPLSTLQPSIGALDAARFRWSQMPDWTLWAGIAVSVPAMALMAWVMVTNRHAETTVRIQTDRDHKVVTEGPYQFVRHPMYVGAIAMYFGAGLMLGSEWAVIVAGVIAVLFMWRTALEDRTLRRELPGYEDFTRETRFRLLPGIW